MLITKLKHVKTEKEFNDLLSRNSNVMICCGRMGPMCIPVYTAMEKLEKKYVYTAFRDMDFDMPVAHLIKELPECVHFMGLPFTVYFKDGRVVSATTSIQSEEQIVEILNREFS